MSTTQDHNCIFCKESFYNKEDLQIHFRKHGDPKFNQSMKCSKISTEGPSHGSGDQSEDSQIEMVSCDVCTEMFPTISKAITHKHKVHPDHDAKYFCPWCGKLFTMKHLYNKHIENSHGGNDQSEKSGFHCDSCEVDFFVPSAMVYHNKFFHRQDTELAVIGHSKKMKLFNQEPLPIYYCPFCGEEYFNKVNLHKHMRDDHSDENQSPDDVLRCPLCEAIFYHLDAYELHLTFHSSDDLYCEENEMARDIMEFSLETVSPIMEKVENEADNGTDTANSIGIEELLQQAMNESNDNDNSNSEGVLEKKKKRKKHKKKKTITLDEFLNMNKDVFGEGLGDVQGIEEVPTQVVAKQLKPRKPPKIVVGAKLTPTVEIEKLKKQGIVVKKKLNHPNQFEGIKVMHSKPMSIQNVKAIKINPTAQKPKQFLSSSNDALAKLQNSQIKIVKKGVQSCTASETSKTKTLEEADIDSEKPDSQNTSDMEETENATGKEKEQNEGYFTHKEKDNKVKMSPKNTTESNSESPEQGNSTSPVDHRNQDMEEEAESQVLGNNQNSKKILMVSDSHKGIPKINKPKMNSTETFNALKNLSQHITIKPMSSPNNTFHQQKCLTKLDDDECQSSDADEDHIEDEIETTDNKATESIQNNSDKKPLNALIRLSHLTVKSVNQTKSASSVLIKNNLPDHCSADKLDIEKYVNNSGIPKPNTIIDTAKESKVDVQQESFKSLDAMKNISKHVTIKSLKPSPKSAKVITEKADHESDNDDHVDEDPDLETNTENGGCIFVNKNLKLPNSVTMKSLKSPVMKSQTPSNSPKSTNRFVEYENLKTDKEVPLKIDEATKQTCTNILKQLPNITAKSLNSIKNVQSQVTVNTPKQAMNMQKCNFVQKSFKTEETDEEIEIFNIDDSDEEEMSYQNRSKNDAQIKSITNSLSKAKRNITNQKLDLLRNLNKNITIKSTNQFKSANSENCQDDESNKEYYSDHENETMQRPVEKTTSLNNTLRNLGKNITVTSSSPKTSVFSANTSPMIKDVVRTSNSDSDQEISKSDENDDDIESQITTSILPKRFPDANRKPDCLSNLKNITIKSLKDMNFDDEENDDDANIHDSVHETKPIIPKFGKHMSVKPFKQLKSHSEATIDVPINKNMKQQIVSRSSNQSFNQKVSTSDQVNAINKEVTVQTFQTKTVIEEVTTTVTKTIRTLNQTVKQEIRNTNQNTPMIRPQRIQGIRPNQPINNLQGTQVRTAMPTMRPRIRNSAPANRPVVGSFVRSPNHAIPVRGSVTTSNHLGPFRPPMATSNQLVPVRPGLTVRGNSPCMPSIRKPGPSLTTTQTGPQRPVFGKPLKISPTAMTSNKRLTSVETAGPFSCFKKPKESPIPSFDDSEGQMHFASSSQTSRSNFSSTTKTVKDNSLVTSSQMSSEISASMQQISNLSMSGIKVVKTSKAKQTTQVEEKSDVSSTKRSALEAIERLQKQGLLVKKPRAEEHDSDNEYYDSGSDNDDDCYDNT
ncbi:uncharacterized protein LOC113235617 isoform X2 [Hyposmocoma kahamanoa]|uniref:uncharacterized protein LOC113235617 isoform X2 n=1 Tax=Hyposmocoma kahamanoa TaxID=1477025 RepID=UPI000E6D7650|nr:uncharacterized protein LOC113235617 isoform X2 [Hyposmocoma kahamanoa]